MLVDALVEIEPTLPHDRAEPGEADLAAVRVACEHECCAAALGVVEVVRLVGEQEMRRPVRRE